MEKYQQKHTVKNYESNKYKQLRLLPLFNLFQDLADTHATLIGVGYEFCLQQGFGWVGAGYHIKINRLPIWNEEITLSTWPSDKTVVSGIREFQVKNNKGESLIESSSQWALMNFANGRPMSVTKHLPDYDILPQRLIDTKFPAIPVPERVDFEQKLPVRFDDIDLNDHVNNAIYPLWASEAVPVDFRETQQVDEMEIAFKKPATLHDDILIQTQIDGNTTIHLIRSADMTKDFSRVKIIWKPI